MDIQLDGLAAALGIAAVGRTADIDAALRTLHSAGVTSESAHVVDLLPVIQVAWLGGMQIAERNRILTAAGDSVTAPILALVVGWVLRDPGRPVFEAGRLLLRQRLRSLPDDERARLTQSIMVRCFEVADAAGGGWTGLRRVSEVERRLLNDLETL